MDPVRMCVGCRTRAPRSALLRVVSQNNTLVLDERAVLPGRGAWVHPTQECMDAALRRRAFGRALRVSATLDTQTIEQHPLRTKG
ncbi:YlxR family protein [Microbacterium sufflavum]|uniref:YlxR family protein n=2 Tax=Microbacteriaceae TaxID=85023 RepID=A0ABY4IH01_9MICO|nr:YlxR family protein [Aneurinibacillus sp. BA2021]MCK2027098.1 YlxR family protein [Microbacterium sufflavum]MPS76314.1 YlxR family protein [Microbacterium sp.]UPL11842.1 YlxR family protein [Microbacterium sufflavum]